MVLILNFRKNRWIKEIIDTSAQKLIRSKIAFAISVTINDREIKKHLLINEI